ncbi:hypothetical protein [Acidovorax sp. ACV01]|uniref:hypothetical protein n=1 Tax=Acidovorax sp. ACV01 TaxID=2769311 RepID=UPI001780E87A|nr:hypothetical protein [Acidovorax sp. ACV01]MBD9393179.1 hypothetical protein [Acidovorax sp. ACV01]
MSNPALQLNALDTSLVALQRGDVRPAAFSAEARAQTALLAALPPRYATVLHDLLDRLESSALFSEESCSFSQKDLLDSLRMWVDKARGVLEQP